MEETTTQTETAATDAVPSSEPTEIGFNTPFSEIVQHLDAQKAAEAGEDAAEAPAEPEQEAAEPEAPAEPEQTEDKRISRAFADLARRERAMQKQQAEFKAQIEETNKHKAVMAKIKSGAKGFVDALPELGLSFDDIAAEIINGKQPEAATKAMEDKIAALEARLEAERGQREAIEAARTAEGYITDYKNIMAGEDYRVVRDFYELYDATPESEIHEVYSRFANDPDNPRHLTPQEMADIIKSGAEAKLKTMMARPAFSRLVQPPQPTTPAKSQQQAGATTATIGKVTQSPGDSPDLDSMTFEERSRHVMKHMFGK